MRSALILLFAVWGCCGPASAQNSKLPVRALGNAFADVYEKVAPSVVVLEVAKQEAEMDEGTFAWEFLLRDRRLPGARPRVEESEGSGFIIRPDGYIITNAHVIEGADPDRGVVARQKDGTRMPLRVVGIDDKTDIAVLKADAKGLSAITWGDSDSLRVGEFVCGIGAPFELDYTLTAGIVSAKGRSNLTSTVYEDYIQTDASINPGNSGGPLCDLDGHVVGVNTLINGLNRGLSFAIPSKIAKAVSDELIASGRVVRPWLGIRIETLSDDPALQKMIGRERGVLVRSLEPDAPASHSEVRPADVIVAVDGEPVETARQLQQAILRKKVGQAVRLNVWRRGADGGAFREMEVTTAELPQSPVEARGGPNDGPPGPGEGVEFESLGLQLQNLDPEMAKKMGLEAGGVIVTHVEPDSAAGVAGLRRRDVITAVGDDIIAGTDGFATAMAKLAPGESTTLLIERDGQKTYANLKP
ncbi:MAG: PDZ domain-containing protein [Chthoniobacterales bacterium]|nr:PDZ domain-containing protein [Chthoniobacterales bacterium]